MAFIRSVFLMALLTLPAMAADLPKCRNVAGYEPKPTCEARNQRAQWQAQETARQVAAGVEQALQRQAAAAAAAAEAKGDDGGVMGTLTGLYEQAVKTVSGFF